MTLADEEILARVHRFREAARGAVRADAPFTDRCLALLDIADMAREEPDLTIRTWAERAIWEESKDFLGMDDAEPALPNPSFERKVRALRREGLVRCDRCGHELPTDDELERWSRMRRQYAETLEAREQAVES
jgi:hypothetical protein